MPRDRPAAGAQDSTLEGEFPSDLGGGGASGGTAGTYTIPIRSDSIPTGQSEIGQKETYTEDTVINVIRANVFQPGLSEASYIIEPDSGEGSFFDHTSPPDGPNPFYDQGNPLATFTVSSGTIVDYTIAYGGSGAGEVYGYVVVETPDYQATGGGGGAV